jgi:hypothetical protein
MMENAMTMLPPRPRVIFFKCIVTTITPLQTQWKLGSFRWHLPIWFKSWLMLSAGTLHTYWIAKMICKWFCAELKMSRRRRLDASQSRCSFQITWSFRPMRGGEILARKKSASVLRVASWLKQLSGFFSVLNQSFGSFYGYFFFKYVSKL